MLATTEFRAAAHHALFAERMLPVLSTAEGVIAEAEATARNPSSHVSMKARQEMGERYRAAQELVPALRALLYPED